MSKKTPKQHDEFESVEHALTTSEAFIEKYQKQILYSVAALVLIVLAVLAFRNYYQKPREIAAQVEMYKAETYFAADSFKVALEGDGVDFIGFKEIASEYGSTASGKLAAAYAGICYYHLGQFDNAIKYLSQYDGKESYLSVSVIGLLGDAHVELGQQNKALTYFKKASDANNDVLSPLYLKKAGLIFESLNQLDKAEKNYLTIKEKYPRSNEASDIEKYLARVQK